jgi:ESCRT-II complex subunit VPS22
MKKVGLAAFEDTKSAYQDLSSTILQKQVEELNTQLSVFQSALNYFAVEHAAEIRTNPEFRSHFARMCTAIGVDPLASSSNKKGGSLWASLLGKDVSDFYFELAVRIVEICRLTRNVNGGIIPVSEVKSRLADKSQLRPIEVSYDDIIQAVKSLKVLGSGFEIVVLSGNKAMIRSVPSELSNDQASIFEASQALGFVTVSMLRDNFGWTTMRCSTVLNEMIKSGLLWIDTQGDEPEYWMPSWIDS